MDDVINHTVQQDRRRQLRLRTLTIEIFPSTLDHVKYHKSFIFIGVYIVVHRHTNYRVSIVRITPSNCFSN